MFKKGWRKKIPKLDFDPSQPLTLLQTDIMHHDYNHCKDSECSTCNLMADSAIVSFKELNNKMGRQRLTKHQVNTLKNLLGEKITNKAISRGTSNDAYTRSHYKTIPCSCNVENHNECNGMYFKETKYGLMSMPCKCKRHSRKERKEFRQNTGQLYA